MKENKYLKGKTIEPLRLEGNEKVADFIKNVYGNSGYNARRLGEACNIFSRMINDNATICLTLAGAMTPIGMSGPIIEMMRLGFIDFMISTGANLYHDMHRPYDMLMVQGEVNVDDKELNKCGIARIYDIFIQDSETLFPTDKCILNAIESLQLKDPISTAQLHKVIGDRIRKTAPYPEKSILAKAAEYNIPIYSPSPGDSSIAMNMALPYFFGHKLLIDPILDVIETTAIVKAAKKNGVVICGGGAPKNFYLQTQPTLQQIFRDKSKKGHDYFIQLTTDSPHWGGLSGATPNEAVSWGKVKKPEKNSVVVYSCASITLPLLFQYVKMTQSPRGRKNLGNKIKPFTESLFESIKSNTKLTDNIKKYALYQNYKRIYEKILGPQKKES